MKDETKTWLDYAKENFESARVLLESNLFNPCLQNVQQCVEKALKSLLIEKNLVIKKTHSTTELKNIIENEGIQLDFNDDDSDFLDSIYLPSKYPLGSVLPFYEPNEEICIKAVKIAESVLKSILQMLK